VSREVHASPPALAGPLRLRKPSSSFLRATPAGASDTDVFFPYRPSDAEPLTTRRPEIRTVHRLHRPGCRGSRPVTVSRDLDRLLASPVKDPREHRSGPPFIAVADPHQVGAGLEALIGETSASPPAPLPATELSLGHPDPVPGATPVRFGSRRPFTCAGPPPLGGAPSPASFTHAAWCLPSRAPEADDARRHLQLSRPTDTAASPDPRRRGAYVLADYDHTRSEHDTPHSGGAAERQPDQGYGALPLP